MTEPTESASDKQKWIPLVAAVILFILYFYPLWILWHEISIKSGNFSTRSDTIKALSDFLSNEAVIADSILTVIIGVLIGGGISYLSRKGAKKPEEIFYLALVATIGLALVLAWFIYFRVETNAGSIRFQYGVDAFQSIRSWIVGRTQDLLSVFALLLGLKGAERFAAFSSRGTTGGNTE